MINKYMNIKKYTSIAIILVIMFVVAILLQRAGKFIESMDMPMNPNGYTPVIIEDRSQEHVDRISSNVWIWSETYYGTGPDLDGLSPVKPKKEGVFTLTFKKDGTFSGTTDCNQIGGKYKIDYANGLEFSQVVSTKMYCEGSQEVEYLKMLDHAGLNWEEDRFVLMNDKTIIFKKGAQLIPE